MNQGMNINRGFNNPNLGSNNPPKFSTKSYNVNSDIKYSTLNENSNTQKYKSVTGRTFDNYENVRIDNQRFIDELNNKH